MEVYGIFPCQFGALTSNYQIIEMVMINANPILFLGVFSKNIVCKEFVTQVIYWGIFKN